MEIAVSLIFIGFIIACIYITTTRQRYRDPGQAADYRNIEEYGVPAKTLYMSSQVFTLHHRIEITDDAGNVAYRAETQFLSIHDKYSVDIYKTEYEEEVVAILITLQHMLRDRAASSGAGAGGSSSN